MVLTRLRSILGRPTSIPFSIEELDQPDAQVRELFLRSFRALAPDTPKHFVARWHRDGSVRGYVHYTVQEPGVYLCGGLCVDVGPYREMAPSERGLLRAEGSLSRWLLKSSIARLAEKKVVFAYTGNSMSLRDCYAIGFERTAHPHLIVQWHSLGQKDRAAVVERICDLGPF